MINVRLVYHYNMLGNELLQIFDGNDVEYLSNHFTVEQLRVEIKHARNRMHGECDWLKQSIDEDYIRTCQLAINLVIPDEPNKFVNKYESVESIKAKHDLVDYISQYIQLKKSGDKFQGLCPFHADKKSASFFVYSDNTYHCFGCQAHGSIIDFVMKYDNLDFKGALAKLSR